MEKITGNKSKSSSIENDLKYLSKESTSAAATTSSSNQDQPKTMVKSEELVCGSSMFEKLIKVDEASGSAFNTNNNNKNEADLSDEELKELEAVRKRRLDHFQATNSTS